MKDRASSVIFEVAIQQCNERGHILNGQEYNTRHGVSAIPDEIRREIRRDPCQPEVQQEPVVYLLLDGSVGWKPGISGLLVPAAAQPPQAAHRGRAEADPGVRRHNPNLGMVELWHRLRQRGYTRRPESLFRVMRKLGLFAVAEKEKAYKPKPYEQMTYPGQQVQVDVKVVPRRCIADQELRLYQYTAIDEFIRLRFLATYPEQSTYSSANFLKRLFKWYVHRGIRMECVQTDNGFEFTNRFPNSKRELPTLFETTAAELSIRHKLIRPYTPRHNGKVERSHREDQKRFYACHSFYSLDDFAKQLAIHNRSSNNFPMCSGPAEIAPIADMEAQHREFSSIDEINLAELGRRTGLSRAKLRHLKANGFCETAHGLIGKKKNRILDGYSAVLNRLLRSGVSNSAVCLDRLQEIGFTGSCSTVKRYIDAHKHLIPAKRQQVAPQGNRGRRYSTAPGEAYQMDWGFTDVLDYDGNTYRAACFAMICHHCGQRYIEFFPNAKQENLFIGMIHAFQYMGMPKVVLTDNMKSVVLHRDLDGHPVWQKDYETFMKALGFETKLCNPRNPFTKDKVERLV